MSKPLSDRRFALLFLAAVIITLAAYAGVAAYVVMGTAGHYTLAEGGVSVLPTGRAFRYIGYDEASNTIAISCAVVRINAWGDPFGMYLTHAYNYTPNMALAFEYGNSSTATFSNVLLLPDGSISMRLVGW